MNKDFLWGSATASYQCEGAWDEDGRAPSFWDVYLHEQQLENGDIASDHYHRFEEDIKMMSEGGQNSYRFSISWSRVISDEDGTINPKGIAFYHRVIDTCLKYGVEPLVTIFHWDTPDFLEVKGGWLNPQIIDWYVYFSKVLFEEYGEKVTYWATFNEPRYYVFSGYFIGNYPPGLQDSQKTITASYNMMVASAAAVKQYRTYNFSGKIGIVHSYAPIYGVDSQPETIEAMRFADNYYNNWILDTSVFGAFPADLMDKLALDFDLSFVQDEHLAILKENTVDFLGLNYYSRALIRPYVDGETILKINNAGSAAKGSSKIVVKNWFEQLFNIEGAEFTEWDTEIYPQGLYEGILMAHQKYNLPIYITENGVGAYETITASMPDDSFRISFLNDHIDAIQRSIADGADVRGYYVWSTMDLYSWKNGHDKRYGLVAVDFDNGQTRIPKKSYYWYKEIAESNGTLIKKERVYRNEFFSMLDILKGSESNGF